MKVEAIKTRIVRVNEINLEDLLTESLDNLAKKSGKSSDEILPENSVVVISSKVVSLCENNIVPKSEIEKRDLIIAESDFYYFPKSQKSDYEWHFAIKNGCLAPAAGIDESNVDDDFYVLWPQNSQQTANRIREFLSEKFARKNLGVLIIDSTCLPPLKRGTIGIFLAFSGFLPMCNLAGTEDLFGRKFQFEQHAIAGGLAAAANLAIGEGAECTPIAILSGLDFVEFVMRNPTREEIDSAFVEREIDLYAPFLNSVKWQKGGGGYKKIS